MSTFAQKQALSAELTTSSLTGSKLSADKPNFRERTTFKTPQTAQNHWTPFAAPPDSATANSDESKRKPEREAPLGSYQNFALIPVHARAVPTLQTKLVINKPGDEYEQEADRVADQVMRMPNRALPMSAASFRMSASEAPGLQRQCACGGTCSDCQKTKPKPEPEKLQRRVTSSMPLEPAIAPPIVREVLRSPGQPLDSSTCAFMEPRFGHDFSRVRVHADLQAAASASAVQARAYTVGSDLVFAAGQFAPATPSGRALLAHELTHVLQQRKGEPGGPQTSSLQRQPQSSGSVLVADPDGLGSKYPDVTVARVAEIERRIERVLDAPTSERSKGRADFNASPARAKANVYHSYFRTAEDRVSYAMGYLEAGFGIGGEPVDRKDLKTSLFKIETDIVSGSVDVVVHSPATKAETQKLNRVQAQRDADTYDFYLNEVARLKAQQDAEACQRDTRCSGYHGAATTDIWHQYIFDPAVDAASHLYEEKGLPLASTLLDFVPVGGQLKILVEGIWGQDLLTRRKLPGWERVLNIVLAVIPEAKGVFSAGREGLTKLAGATLVDGLDAAEVYRSAKAVSSLTAEDIRAAEELVEGARANAAQRKVIQLADEMNGSATHSTTLTFDTVADTSAGQAVKATEKTAGNTAKTAGKGAQEAAKVAGKGAKTVAQKLAELKGALKIAGEDHVLILKRIGDKVRLLLCSKTCGELILKARAMLTRLPARDVARGEFEKLISELQTESWLDDVQESLLEAASTDPEAAAELEKVQKQLDGLAERLQELGERHPGSVIPDIEVTPATDEIAPDPEPQHAENAPPQSPRVLPEDLDPPGTPHKRPIAGQTGKEAKDQIPGWVRTDRYPNPRAGENGTTYAKRILDHKFGPGNWSEGPATDYNKIKKWANEHWE